MTKEDSVQKAGWDARQQYSLLLQKSIDLIRYYHQMNDIDEWVKALEFYAALTKHRLGDTKHKSIIKQLRQMRSMNYLQEYENMGNLYYQIIDNLTTIESDLLAETADLLLPIKEEGDSGDMDDILKEGVR